MAGRTRSDDSREGTYVPEGIADEFTQGEPAEAPSSDEKPQRPNAPTLGAVQALAIDEASAGRGALLGVAYCIGLGVPFLLVALGLQSSERMLDFLRKHRLAALRIGGGMLVLVGLLLVTGLWTRMTGAMQLWIGGFETVI